MPKSDDLKNRLEELFSNPPQPGSGQPPAEPAATSAGELGIGLPVTAAPVPAAELPAASETPDSRGMNSPITQAFQDAFAYLNMGMAIVGLDGRFTQVNEAFCQLVGYPKEELQSKSFQELTYVSDQQVGIEALKSMLAGETKSARIAKRYLHKEGYPIWVDLNITLISDQAGRPTHFLSFIQDISSQHRTAGLLEKRVRELNCLNDIGHKIDEKPVLPEFLQWVSERIPAAFQYPEECIAAIQYGSVVYGNPRTLEQTSKAVGGLRVNGELVGWLHVAYTEMRDFVDAESALLGSIVSRVSGYIETCLLLEKSSQALKITQESQQMLEEALRLGKTAYWEFDVAAQKFAFNDQWFNLYRTTPEREGGYLMPAEQFARKFVHPDSAATVGQNIMEAIQTTDPNYYHEEEARIIFGDGSPAYILLRFRIQKDEQGRTVKLYGTNQDITDRKLAEEKVVEEERQLVEALRVGKMAYWEFEVATQMFIFNEQWFNLYHARPERAGDYQMPAETFARNFVHPDSAVSVGQNIMAALQTTDPDFYHEEETKVIFGDGSLGYILLRFQILKDAQGQTVKLYGTNQDITERKLAEEKVIEEERQLEEALRVGKMAYWEFDVPSQMFTFNDQWFNLFRTSAEREGGYQMTAAHFAQNFVHPDSAATVGQNIGQAIQSTDPDYYHEEEARIIFGDGSPAFILLRMRVQKDAQGQTVKLYGTNQDITERKVAEALVERRAAELATVAQISTAIATELDPQKLLQSVVDLTKEDFNLYHAHIYLLNEAKDELVLAAGAGEVGRQMVGEGWRIPLDRERSLVSQAARTRQGVTVNDVQHVPDFLPNPHLPDTHAELAVPLLVGGQVLGVLDVQSTQAGAFQDEDLRIHTTLAAQVAVALQNARQYEEAHNSEQMVRSIIDATPDWVFVKDLNHRFILVNQSFAVAQNRDVNDFYGKDDLEVGFPREMVMGDEKQGIPGYWWDDQAVLDSGQPKTVTGEQNEVGGEVHYFDVYKAPLRDLYGNIVGLLGYARDVSERARLLMEAERQAQVMAILNEMGQVLNVSLAPEYLLNTIHTYTNRLMEAGNFFVALYDETNETVSFPMAFSDALPVEIPTRPRRKSMTDHILTTREPLLFSDHVEDGMRSIGCELVTYGDDEVAKSWLGVPILYRNRTLGVIAVQSTRVAGLYTETHRELLVAVAAQAANALILAEQFAETQRVLAQTQEYAGYLGVLNEIAARMNTARDEKEICQIAGGFASRIPAFTLASVSLLDTTGDTLELFAVSDTSTQVVPLGLRVPVALSASGQVVLSRRLMAWPEEGSLDAFFEAPQLREMGMQAAMSAPLIAGSEVIGTLNVSSAGQVQFEDRDKSLLRQVTALAGAAIENRRLLEQVQKRARQEQALREISTKVRGTLDADTILRTTVRELGDILGRKTFIRLGNDSEVSPYLGGEAALPADKHPVSPGDNLAGSSNGHGRKGS